MSARLPTTLTILPTYNCTAACENCCFGSHPGITERVPLDRILAYIDQAATVESMRLIVFSGGECFTLGDDLVAAVARATGHGLATRCVTNAYWASTEERALERLGALAAAGLTSST
jgi:MoaA/NifB/PqqE/SkfB family radical SAM enzyme